MDRKRQHTGKLNLRIDPDLRAAVEQIAEAKERSVAWVVRDALTRYVEQQHGLTRAEGPGLRPQDSGQFK